MSRSALARSVPSFGRRAPAIAARDTRDNNGRLADDVRLFALTFIGSFLFMSVYLA